MTIAITREVSSSINECELTFHERVTIDVARAREQHRAYCQALESLGSEVITLPQDPAFPDAVFVEDTAVVLDELAIITRPGAESRRREPDAVAEVLGRYRKLRRIEAPATLDGGDVLRVDRQLFVGLSTRTDPEAVRQLSAIAEPLGYQVHSVDVHAALHLKTAVTQVAANTLLINAEWVNRQAFSSFDLIEIDPAEPYAANALLIGDRVIYAREYPRTIERLTQRGIRLYAVPASELAKAEGGVTCCCLTFGS